MLSANNPNIEKAETSGPQNFLSRQVSLFGKFHASEILFKEIKEKEKKKPLAPDEWCTW